MSGAGHAFYGWVQNQAAALGAAAGAGGGDNEAPEKRDVPRADRSESTPWFQEILNTLWPEIRGAVEHELLRGSVAKKLSKAVPGLYFPSAYLGDTPPQLHGVRTVPGEQKGSMCTIFDFGFGAGSSINICIGLGPLRAGITQLNFRGRICICFVGLKPRKPVVSGLRIFFTNVPTLSFRFGGLAAMMPIHPDKLRSLVLKIIADKIVLPNSKTVHIDVITGQVNEAGFLPYSALHSPPPHGLLHLSVLNLDGLPYSPNYYINARVGSQQRWTKTPAQLGVQGYSGWMRRNLDFVVDLFLDQDLQVELFQEGDMMMAADRLIGSGSISMPALQGQFRVSSKSGSMPTARVEIRPPLAGGSGGHGGHGAGVATLVGSYQPLSLAPPPREAGHDVQYLLQIVVDCVSGLRGSRDKQKFSIRARVNNSSRQGAIDDVCSSVKASGRGVVANSRLLSANGMDDMLWGEVKQRIKFLLAKGGKWTPEEITYVLPGMVPPDVAARLMKEIEKEGLGDVSAQGGVEILFEQQLRLEVSDPHNQALCVELVAEPEGTVEGSLVWQNLAWLAGRSPMEDEMQGYHLHGSEEAGHVMSPTSGQTYATMYLKRALLHRRPEARAYRSGHGR